MTASASQSLEDLHGAHFDALVIGAGINGASAAQHLASAGFKVLLTDKGDLASGSSGRSTRVLHCGLRYFESPQPMRDFLLSPRRAREAVAMAQSAMRTRSRLCRDAASRLQRFTLLFPIAHGGPYRPWQVDLAFRVLAALDDLKHPLDYRRIDARAAAALPFVDDLADPASLHSVAAFTEYMFDWPERFVVDCTLDAERLGACIRTYTQATPIEHDGHGWRVRLTAMQGEPAEAVVHAAQLVNMAGIWIDRVNSDAGSTRRLILGTKGAHLAVRLPPAYADYGLSTLNSELEPHYIVPGRAGLHHIGPTETVYQGDPDDIRASAEDVDFLLEETARLLPGLAIDRSDVVFTWAGVRPLTYDPSVPKGKRTRELHRLDADGAPDVLAMTAGPIMGHRSAGEEVVAALRERATPSGAGAPMQFAPRRFPDDQNSARLAGPKDPTTGADLVHALRTEHAHTLEDLLLRRTGLVWTGLIDAPLVDRAADAVAAELGWSEVERAQAVRAFLALYEHRYGVPDDSEARAPTGDRARGARARGAE